MTNLSRRGFLGLCLGLPLVLACGSKESYVNEVVLAGSGDKPEYEALFRQMTQDAHKIHLKSYNQHSIDTKHDLVALPNFYSNDKIKLVNKDGKVPEFHRVREILTAHGQFENRRTIAVSFYQGVNEEHPGILGLTSRFYNLKRENRGTLVEIYLGAEGMRSNCGAPTFREGLAFIGAHELGHAYSLSHVEKGLLEARCGSFDDFLSKGQLNKMDTYIAQNLVQQSFKSQGISSRKQGLQGLDEELIMIQSCSHV